MVGLGHEEFGTYGDGGDSSDVEESFGTLLERHPFKASDKFVGAAVDSGSKKSPKKTFSTQIDLHGKTLKEAQVYLESQVSGLLATHGKVDLKIITGRGRHSQSGPVLAENIHSWIRRRYRDSIVSLQECPSNSMINGIAVRGYFHVKLRL